MKIKILLLFLFLPVFAFAQEKSTEEIQAMLEGKNFTYDATVAYGMRGRMINLTAGYQMIVTPDQITGDLPFYGRSFQADPGSSDVGLKFDISEFEYEVTPRKKKGWEVKIKSTQSGSSVRSIFLTVQENGNASLRIISNGKDAMSYNGNIK